MSEGLLIDEVLARLGVDRRESFRIVNRDRWRWDLADAVAIALGRHPCELWPDWFA